MHKITKNKVWTIVTLVTNIVIPVTSKQMIINEQPKVTQESVTSRGGDILKLTCTDGIPFQYCMFGEPRIKGLINIVTS